MSKKGKRNVVSFLAVAVMVLLIVGMTGCQGEEEDMPEPEFDGDIDLDDIPEIAPGPDGEDEEITAYLRIEGIQENIYSGGITTKAEEESTAMDKFNSAMEAEGIEYETDEFNGGTIITSISGEEAGTYGGNDGWLFMVNNEMVPMGADEYVLEDGDEVVFFYGEYPPGTLIPQVEVNPSPAVVGEEFTVTVTSQYIEDFDSDEMVTEDIEGATVSFDGSEYTTDAEGQVEIEGVEEEGEFVLEVEKNRENSYPAIVRTSDSVRVPVRE